MASIESDKRPRASTVGAAHGGVIGVGSSSSPGRSGRAGVRPGPSSGAQAGAGPWACSCSSLPLGRVFCTRLLFVEFSLVKPLVFPFPRHFLLQWIVGPHFVHLAHGFTSSNYFIILFCTCIINI